MNCKDSAFYSFLPMCLHSGSGPCIGEAAQPEEQVREQTGEHWSEEDTHGTVLRGLRTGTGGWILERKRRMRCAGLGKVWVPSDEIATKNECRVSVKTGEGEKKKQRRCRELLQGKRKDKNKSDERNGFSLL